MLGSGDSQQGNGPTAGGKAEIRSQCVALEGENSNLEWQLNISELELCREIAALEKVSSLSRIRLWNRKSSSIALRMQVKKKKLHSNAVWKCTRQKWLTSTIKTQRHIKSFSDLNDLLGLCIFALCPFYRITAKSQTNLALSLAKTKVSYCTVASSVYNQLYSDANEIQLYSFFMYVCNEPLTLHQWHHWLTST